METATEPWSCPNDPGLSSDSLHPYKQGSGSRASGPLSPNLFLCSRRPRPWLWLQQEVGHRGSLGLRAGPKVEGPEAAVQYKLDPSAPRLMPCCPAMTRMISRDYHFLKLAPLLPQGPPFTPKPNLEHLVQHKVYLKPGPLVQAVGLYPHLFLCSIVLLGLTPILCFQDLGSSLGLYFSSR